MQLFIKIKQTYSAVGYFGGGIHAAKLIPKQRIIHAKKPIVRRRGPGSIAARIKQPGGPLIWYKFVVYSL
jgi:hypothetical protein